MYAKLDGYDYELYFLDEKLVQIEINVDSNTDVIIGDISTEINANEGSIYVEGFYVQLIKMNVEFDILSNSHTIVIEVMEED